MDYLRKIYKFAKRPKIAISLIITGIGTGVVIAKFMGPQKVALSTFLAALSAQKITNILDYGETVKYTTTNRQMLTANIGQLDKSNIIDLCRENGIEYDTHIRSDFLHGLYVMSISLASGVALYTVQSLMSTGAEKPLRHRINTRFSSIAGCNEAKNALQEVIDYFKDPTRYTAFGARLPRGVLLYGPPGSGKTLLAKATAGESNVNFISCSGSEFIEVYIGVGPKRVRDIFNQARENSPCILFIDEIESLATKRTLLESATNFESQSTINQLLTEMDGFQSTENIVVIGATNRPDLIDEAILRPGRFDRKIEVSLPNAAERYQMIWINLASRMSEVTEEVIREISDQAVNFSGADIESMVNEAWFECIRQNSSAITNQFLVNTFLQISDRMKLFQLNCMTRSLAAKEHMKRVFGSADST